MKEKHTSDPWKVFPDTEKVKKEWEAKKRLEDAAPDLLAALRAIVARIDGVWDDPDLMAFGPLMPEETDDIFEIASQAIAKATGV